VKSSALEVDGGERRHLVVCGTEGTFHIQPLDDPSARVTFSAPHGPYRKGYQDVSFPKYTRYLDDAADMARVIRGEKEIDFPPRHDLAVQRAVLQACGMSTEH
jgi:predicted dehydrogenase